MKTALPGGLPSVGADLEALIKEARRRQHRRYLAVGLAVVVMLAGAVGVTVSVTGPGGHGPSHQGARRVPTARGKSPSSTVFARSAMPRFFADAVTTGEGNESLQVRASANGRLVAQEEHMTGVYGLAATGADSFVIALQAGAGCAARLYRVQLNGQGHPGGLSPVGPELRGLVWSLAASAGGGIIGYAVSGCAKGDPGYIGIFDTRTGRSERWSDVNLGGVSPGNVAMQGALSMSASGRLLAFTGWDVAGDGRYTSQVVRVLSTTAPAGTVAERSHVALRGPVSQPELTAAEPEPWRHLLLPGHADREPDRTRHRCRQVPDLHRGVPGEPGQPQGHPDADAESDGARCLRPVLARSLLTRPGGLVHAEGGRDRRHDRGSHDLDDPAAGYRRDGIQRRA